MKLLKKAHFRVELDERNEKIGYRIREAQIKKVPYQLVLGDREGENKTVTYRKHGQRAQITVTQDEVIALLKEEVENKTFSDN